MHLSSRLLAAALPFAASLVHAQGNNNYTTGLVAALNSVGLTSLAAALNSPAVPPALLSALQQGNHTVFAPNNAALGAVDPSALANLANILAYHVTAGHVDVESLKENTTTVVRSSLAAEPAVLLPANQSQVIVLSKATNGTLILENDDRNVHTSTNATYQNLQVFVVDRVLRIPANFSTVVAGQTELSALAGAVTAALPDLVPTLTRAKGLTLFAPVNSAIQAVSEQLGQVNASTLTSILLNHLINGTAVYSTQITENSNLNLTSAGGSPTTFVSNSSGVFVTSGSSTAKIVKANVLTSNGVIHLIDRVLLNTDSNPGQASSAAASYSSVQASQTASQTGAVTAGPGTGAAGSLILGGGAAAVQLGAALGAVVVGALLGAHLL
ncbi:hypothetical protein FRB91_011383 [Serendipita sp. 411]|nr:hypothetical protein FRC18_007141 [Serendipita sp. 400]KAG8847846.1 hypothetical protein FRB91_011383 [Serendipita sp. 411]